MTAADPFVPLFIGTSPAGVSWIARRMGDIEPMRARLADLAARHAAKQSRRIRRVRITTPLQFELIERFLSDDSGANLRKTYIEASGSELHELADLIDGETDDSMYLAAEGSMSAQTDQERSFAAVAGGLSCLVLAGRLRGKEINRRRARRDLAARWG